MMQKEWWRCLKEEACLWAAEKVKGGCGAKAESAKSGDWSKCGLVE